MSTRTASTWMNAPTKYVSKCSPLRIYAIGLPNSSVVCAKVRDMSTGTQASLDSLQAAMAQTLEIFNSEVFGKRNFDALDNVYTPDARILPPGAPMISGRDAIKKFWSDLVTGANASSAVLSSLDVIVAGDGIVEIGKAVL